MIATIVILIIVTAVVQLVGDSLVRFTTPRSRAAGRRWFGARRRGVSAP